MANEDPYDIFIVGGGINGCGIARDAAGRGYSVCLAEMNDLASATSSGSTKLIHGGLRYLEHYEFRLVREALIERERLWKIAPHIIWPLRFVLPYFSGLRPAWLLRLGLFIYDHLGGRKLLSATRSLGPDDGILAGVVKPIFKKAFEYSDCWVNDARLVVLNAIDAADNGASIYTRTKIIAAVRDGGLWKITLRLPDGSKTEASAKVLVNAAGPWVDHFLQSTIDTGRSANVRLVKGSHIVVPKLYDHDRCFIFQNPDGRITFAIPYEDNFTLIGTTDEDYEGNPGAVSISAEEITYLCDAVNEYFEKSIGPDDVVWSYAATRPLFDDGASKAQEATRDYVIRTEGDRNSGLLVNIFGGKITTFRRLAETVMENIEEHLGKSGEKWTAGKPLPGGDFAVDGYDQEVANLMLIYPFLGLEFARRLIRLYGTRARDLLADAKAPRDLGQKLGPDLYEQEIRFLQETEWAVTADDILWRRTKLGLTMTETEVAALDRYLMEAGATPKANAAP